MSVYVKNIEKKAKEFSFIFRNMYSMDIQFNTCQNGNEAKIVLHTNRNKNFAWLGLLQMDKK